MSAVTELFVLTIGILLFPGIYNEEMIYKRPEIHSLHITSDIRYRYATTIVTSRMKNVDSKSREAIFDVTLPNEAFITNLTLEIDGKIISGEIKEKQAAKQQYQAAQQRGESAGYIGTRHRETNKFNLAVTVAAQSKVSFNLTYQELLKRTRGYYEQVIYIDPGQLVPDMSVTVAIVESREIINLRVPPLRNDLNSDIKDLSSVTAISYPSLKSAHVKFVPSLEFQTAQSASVMSGQFVLQYDVEREMDLGDVLVVNGYFVHFFAPEGLKPIPKDVLFILDTSGSMMGTKLTQLKQAMNSIIGQLVEGDRMNIMTFSGSTSFWKTEMVDIKKGDVLQDAYNHVNSLKASGWTNIELALTTGVTFLNDRLTEDDAIRSPVVVFLTDGEATNGVTNTDEILKNLRKVNNLEIPVFSLAFGKNADYDIVKKISIQNNGLGRKIYDASDAAMQIARLYEEISVTLLNNITFQYLDAPVANVTRHTYTNYFNGTEFVICGHINDVDDDIDISNSLTLKVTSNSADKPTLVLSGALSDNLIDVSSFDDNSTDTGDFEKVTEKVWAYLTIKQLLDKELATSDEGEKQDYKRQILGLSLKYKFVTPLTSMVVTLPKKEAGKTNYVIDDDARPEHLLSRNRGPRSRTKPSHGSRGLYPISKLGSRTKPSHGISGLYPISKLGSRTKPSHGISGLYPSSKLGSRTKPSHGIIGWSLRSKLAYFPTRDSSDIISSPMMAYDAFDAYDTQDSDDDLSRSYFVPTSLQHTNTPKKSKKKGKKGRRKNRNKGLHYPLRIKFQNPKDPICFNMYDKALDTEPEMYNFYSDVSTGLKIDVKLEKTLLGKWTNQGGIKEIHLVSGDIYEILTSKSIKNIDTSVDPNTPWKIAMMTSTKQASQTTELRVQLDAFTMLITSERTNFLNILVERKAGLGKLADSGIIGQIFGKKFKYVKTITKPGKTNKKGRKKPGKQEVIVKVNKSKFRIKRKKVVHRSSLQSLDTKGCFPLSSNREIKMVNITAEMIV